MCVYANAGRKRDRKKSVIALISVSLGEVLIWRPTLEVCSLCCCLDLDLTQSPFFSTLLICFKSTLHAVSRKLNLLNRSTYITFYTTDDALRMCDHWTSPVCDVPKWGKTAPSVSTCHTYTHAESYCEEGTPVGVTIATLINRTSVDVTWCYQILIKLL